MPPSRQLKSFIDALDMAFENPPRDLPDGTMELAKELGQRLRGYGGSDGLSPGEKRAQEAAGGSDVAVHFSKAAVGPDQPSPGQQRVEQAVKQAVASNLSNSLSSQS